ncbi:MAG: hypothetical protein BWY15_01196 [Firmicutes bacterium ADurb.Bin193]|nr:MAG: hypothetical protein BWY15_01196 [Firmicutes bacterium ADurb.Bin193]
MVLIVGREMRIPKIEETVGFVGDNNTEIREFEITDSSLFDFDFKLDLKVKASIGIVDLEKIIEPERVILRWRIGKEHLPEKGMLFAQLRAFKDTDEVWHSEKGQFWIDEGINATEYFPSPLPSEFEQMEQRVTASKNQTLEAAQQVFENTAAVATNAQTVAEKTGIVVQKAFEVDLNTQAVAQNTISALESANTASSSLSDLLNMLGTDVATLTGGKLTPSQIPALSINDVFEVGDTDEMLTLTAQRGDVALIIPDDTVTDSYILAADDACVLANWKKLGVSYVANAGHAVTADNATDSTMINGHRVVYMTQEQYDIAVKDPDTVYMVGVE